MYDRNNYPIMTTVTMCSVVFLCFLIKKSTLMPAINHKTLAGSIFSRRPRPLYNIEAHSMSKLLIPNKFHANNGIEKPPKKVDFSVVRLFCLFSEAKAPAVRNNFEIKFSVPPSVRAVPSSGQITARKGGAVTLECKASGNPVPSIYWTKKVSETSWTAFAGPHLAVRT